MAAFFTSHRGHAYASTALMDPMSKAFVADIHHFIAARGRGPGALRQGAAQGRGDAAVPGGLHRHRGGAVCGPGAGEVERVADPAPLPRRRQLLRLAGAATALVNFFYFYCVDADFGPFFIKFCTYFPFTAKLCINGNEWAKRQAAKAGIGFEPLDNGFAAVEDVAALQAICDSLGPADIDALLRKWLRSCPPVHR